MILATTAFVNQKAPNEHSWLSTSQGKTEVRKCLPFNTPSGAFKPWPHSS